MKKIVFPVVFILFLSVTASYAGLLDELFKWAGDKPDHKAERQPR